MTVGPAPGVASLLRRLDVIVASRDELLAELRALPSEKVDLRSDPATWSPREVVEHMVRAERVVLRGLFEPRYLKPRRKSVKNRILRRVVMAILSGPIRVKVPTAAMEPTGSRTLDELEPEWKETHRRMREFLQEANAETLATGCFRHPISGPLTPADAIALLGTHLERHAAQIRKRLGR